MMALDDDPDGLRAVWCMGGIGIAWLLVILAIVLLCSGCL